MTAPRTIITGPYGILTARETEVLLELAKDGMPYEEVAARLHLSERTVRYHMSNVLGKLGVVNVCAAVVWVWRNNRELIWAAINGPS